MDTTTESNIYLVIAERYDNKPLRAFRDPLQARQWLTEYVEKVEPLPRGEPLDPHLGIDVINMYDIVEVPIEE